MKRIGKSTYARRGTKSFEQITFHKTRQEAEYDKKRRARFGVKAKVYSGLKQMKGKTYGTHYGHIFVGKRGTKSLYR